MRIRFKLRTLLIATALVGLILGLQVHVHMKAVKFVEEMGRPSKENQLRLMADANAPDYEWFAYPSTGLGRELNVDAILSQRIAKLSSVSIGDMILFRRRCEVSFSGLWHEQRRMGSTHYTNIYRFYCFGESCDSTADDGFEVQFPELD